MHLALVFFAVSVAVCRVTRADDLVIPTIPDLSDAMLKAFNVPGLPAGALDKIKAAYGNFQTQFNGAIGQIKAVANLVPAFQAVGTDLVPQIQALVDALKSSAATITTDPMAIPTLASVAYPITANLLTVLGDVNKVLQLPALNDFQKPLESISGALKLLRCAKDPAPCVADLAGNLGGAIGSVGGIGKGVAGLG